MISLFNTLFNRKIILQKKAVHLDFYKLNTDDMLPNLDIISLYINC